MKSKIFPKNFLWVAIASALATYIRKNPTFAYIGTWAVLQWSPTKANISAEDNGENDYLERFRYLILEKIRVKDGERRKRRTDQQANEIGQVRVLATVDVQKHRQDMLQYLEHNFGKDWRRRPVHFKGLWTKSQLAQNNDGTPRKLSLDNLLQMDLKVPYFTNASIKMVTPDGIGSVGSIVHNITLGKPHKIGTQLIVENDPDLIREVAPLDLLNDLFGDYFAADSIRGSGPWNMFPALTTVPVFIANNGKGATENKSQINLVTTSSSNPTTASRPNHLENTTISNTQSPRPFTALHCEPIGNIAVQLSGQKKWTLVQPEYSFQIKPGISPDGRAFFASWANKGDFDNVPTYEAVTTAGDAIWVPTWTWHQVDYIHSEDIALGASLFHFRVLDFVQNNPLFSVLIIPAMVKELLGFNTQ